jgi:hypothetical protein
MGSIPTEFGRCAYLSVLELDHNFLNGTIPSQVKLLSNLGRSQHFMLNACCLPLILISYV